MSSYSTCPSPRDVRVSYPGTNVASYPGTLVRVRLPSGCNKKLLNAVTHSIRRFDDGLKSEKSSIGLHTCPRTPCFPATAVLSLPAPSPPQPAACLSHAPLCRLLLCFCFRWLLLLFYFYRHVWRLGRRRRRRRLRFVAERVAPVPVVNINERRHRLAGQPAYTQKKNARLRE